MIYYWWFEQLNVNIIVTLEWVWNSLEYIRRKSKKKKEISLTVDTAADHSQIPGTDLPSHVLCILNSPENKQVCHFKSVYVVLIQISIFVFLIMESLLCKWPLFQIRVDSVHSRRRTPSHSFTGFKRWLNGLIIIIRVTNDRMRCCTCRITGVAVVWFFQQKKNKEAQKGSRLNF